MEVTQTVICKLAPTPEQAAEIDATLAAFAVACDFAADVARRIGSTNKVKVQRAADRHIRERFGLSAHLAIRAIARACAALKVPEKMHSKFAPTSIDYDARIFAFHEGNGTFGLTLLSGRIPLVAAIGDYQKRSLKDRKPTSATLVKRRDGLDFLHVQRTDDAPDPIEPDDFIGVDLGIANIATDSDGNPHSGEDVETIRRKHNLQRKRLQRKNTRGAKKKIRRMRDKEARFRRYENHVISKAIVQAARDTARGIALEDLDGIRARTTARGGDARHRLSGWAFAQLGSFVVYKAGLAGVPVVFVDPASTSQTWSVCGHRERANRKSQAEFLCKGCGHQDHAARNAARNIRCRALAEPKPAIGLGTPPIRRAV
jgi:putative transposase